MNSIGSRRRLWPALLIGVLALTTAWKLWIAATTIGTNDVIAWERFARGIDALGGIGVYYAEPLFNHPPFMTHALQVMLWLSNVTPLAFPFWLRLPAICADIGSVFILWKFIERRMAPEVSPLALLLLAAAPPAIMIAGFHGNTDPVMIMFVLLSVYLIERRAPLLLAGAALGMAMNIKAVPLIFMPMLFLYLPNMRRRFMFFAAAGATFGAGSLPVLAQDPQFVIARVFGYGSNYGQWGIARTLTLLSVEHSVFAALNNVFALLGKYIALGGIVVAAFRLNLRKEKPPLLLQAGLTAFLFLALAPGFGVQYLAWLVPWIVGMGAGAATMFFTASGLLLFQVYTYWARQFPWYFSDSPYYGWSGMIIAYDLLCWLTVVAITLMYFERLSPLAVRSHVGLPVRRQGSEVRGQGSGGRSS